MGEVDSLRQVGEVGVESEVRCGRGQGEGESGGLHRRSTGHLLKRIQLKVTGWMMCGRRWGTSAEERKRKLTNDSY